MNLYIIKTSIKADFPYYRSRQCWDNERNMSPVNPRLCWGNKGILYRHQPFLSHQSLRSTGRAPPATCPQHCQRFGRRHLLLGLFEEKRPSYKMGFRIFVFSTFCQKSDSRPRANGVRPDHPGYESHLFFYFSIDNHFS